MNPADVGMQDDDTEDTLFASANLALDRPLIAARRGGRQTPARSRACFLWGVKAFACLLLLGPFRPTPAAAADRLDQTLADGWKFIREDVAPDAPWESWQPTKIPHTWNTKEADAGPHPGDPHFTFGYYRGAGWYARSLQIPAAWQGRRVFIRFEAASLVAQVYLNGQLLGEHRGAFTAFCYELTSNLRYGAQNELRVRVDNSYREDVAPLSGDFNVDGGIYRPVHLLVTDAACISPLHLASPGVFETVKSLSGDKAQVEVRTVVSNGKAAVADLRVRTQIRDAAGRSVAAQTLPLTIPAGGEGTTSAELDIAAPHLWGGRSDPYLYTTIVSLESAGQAGDAVTQPLGLREVKVTEDQGFLLNGKPYPIHGICRHQDWGSQGWAVTAGNMDEDARLILEMGATAARMAHYPQSDYWHNLCDRNGLLAWDEVPLVNEVRRNPAFASNAEQQMREMILQLYNHPSIAFWGIFNELHDTKDRLHPGAPPRVLDMDAAVALARQLKGVAGELDSSRIITGATFLLNKPFNGIPERPCLNYYPGWYSGTPDDMTPMVDKFYAELGRRVGLSEYGAGANTAQHQEGTPQQPKPTGPFHPEEWQTEVHERDWASIQKNPHLWGSFIWTMFDFQVASRHEGSLPDLNDKGLVTQDRKIKKDAYFFYQANWTGKPMVYIASRRMTPRRQPATEVKVFSNCRTVELFVNGTSLGTAAPDDVKTFRWPAIALKPGKNEIRATGISSQGKVTDNCEWVLASTAATSP